MRFLPVIAAAALALGAAASTAPAGGDAAPAPVSREDVTVTARYSSSVLIFRVGQITLDARFGRAGYEAESFIEAAGLASLFSDFDIRAEVEGHRSQSGMSADSYAHVERNGSKVRRVDVSFNAGLATSVAQPPFGSWGVPPASPAERTGVMDPMTAFFELSERVRRAPDTGCSGRMPVFDGKARYNLRLEPGGTDTIRTRGWRGEAILCRAFYEPVAGYDPEDQPTEEELRYPLLIWLAPFAEAGVYVPVRLHTRAGFGGVTIELSHIEIA